ncbi:hypothetical protein EDB89DRAFT_2231477 [Lactarius sanguifluus]|nr:hypothetical protein EDB89DRAFT_2231477 [Lactarius sanguifluus]
MSQPMQNTDDDVTASRVTGPSAILSMYIARVQKFEDEINAENWDKGADGILVFTGLFSSTVATFIALSYPNLQQDPNVTTQSLLAQISQQLSNTNITTGPSIQSPFVPPTSVIFINSVWFLSLVLSLTCAMMATLLRHWARRYLQIVQRKCAPLPHARIHEYFSQGASKFGISWFVDVLHALLILSVFLFFAGLVVFAFLGNHNVAYCTLTIVGLCAFLYIVLSLLPLMFHDCPYHTPLTPFLRSYVQAFSFYFFLPHSYVLETLRNRWGLVFPELVRSLDQLKNKAKYLSENIISKLENSTEPLSIDTYKNLLARTLHWLNEDDELEDFVAGIPSLYESEAFPAHNDDNAQHNLRPVLADLPGLTGSHASLPWNIIQLAQRASTSRPAEFVQEQRTQFCLSALYYIPGAIRDVLAPYAADKGYYQKVLPLLNTPESLQVIDKLWDTPNDDIALSVRCAAAVVAAFMITPPDNLPDDFVTLSDTGERFLARRLHVGDGAPHFHPHSDSARLRNIERFLTDIKDILPYVGAQWWTFDDAPSIRRQRLLLSDLRHTVDYRMGYGTFDQHGERASPMFLRAAQQDLITLTLEILARAPVANAAIPQRDAFLDAYVQLWQEAFTQAEERAQEQALEQALVQQQPPRALVQNNRARGQVLAEDILTMVVSHALQPVLQTLP